MDLRCVKMDLLEKIKQIVELYNVFEKEIKKHGRKIEEIHAELVMSEDALPFISLKMIAYDEETIDYTKDVMFTFDNDELDLLYEGIKLLKSFRRKSNELYDIKEKLREKYEKKK